MFRRFGTESRGDGCTTCVSEGSREVRGLESRSLLKGARSDAVGERTQNRGIMIKVTYFKLDEKSKKQNSYLVGKSIYIFLAYSLFQTQRSGNPSVARLR